MTEMQTALAQAQMAFEKGEIPVGAAIFQGRKLIAAAHNLTETLRDPTAHAEILAIQQACQKLGCQRLTGCDLYVTLEPCPMCAGAILNARLRAVYIGALDPNAGACGSKIDLLTKQFFNHRADVFYGIDEQRCTALLHQFFAQLREK